MADDIGTTRCPSPDDITWIASPAPMRNARCPVCASPGPHAPVLEVGSMAPPHRTLTFLRCPDCGSAHYDPPGITDFADIGQNRDHFWRFYVEVGGGVWETIWPVLAVRRGPPQSLLDVGCGFGFAVDCWQRSGQGEAVGVELADYGQVGKRLLGITLYDEMLQDCAALAGRRFDVVYASEVIEHVPDPRAFVALLAGHVADAGVLVLTTPNGDYIKRANHSPTLHAALAPGFHGFLLGVDAFADAARRAGFAHVDARVFGERMILWASRRPLAVAPDPARLLPHYWHYLDSRLRDGDPASPVWQGLAYRWTKELVNQGRFEEAGQVAVTLMAALRRTYGTHIADPDATLQRLRGCADLADVGRVIPYFMPNLYYFLGALAQHGDHDSSHARTLYAGAIACTLDVCRFGSVFFLEALSLLWPARARIAELQLRRGELTAGAVAFAALADEAQTCDARNAFAVVGRDLVESTLPALCEQLAAAGHWEPAHTIFASYRRYVERRYGEEVLTPDGVAAALADGNDAAPLDPLFAPFFIALVRQRGGSTVDSSVATLTAVARVGETWRNDESRGPRMRHWAERARRQLPQPAGPVPAWSMDITYTVPGPPAKR